MATYEINRQTFKTFLILDLDFRNPTTYFGWKAWYQQCSHHFMKTGKLFSNDTKS